jgi:hypothetical protein
MAFSASEFFTIGAGSLREVEAVSLLTDDVFETDVAGSEVAEVPAPVIGASLSFGKVACSAVPFGSESSAPAGDFVRVVTVVCETLAGECRVIAAAAFASSGAFGSSKAVASDSLSNFRST